MNHKPTPSDEASSFANMRPADRVKVLERLREDQIRSLVEILDDPARERDMPTIKVVSTLITHLSEAIEVFRTQVDELHHRAFAITAISLILLVTGTVLLLPVRSTPVFIQTKSSAISFLVDQNVAPFRGAGAANSLELSGVNRVFLGNQELPPPVGQGYHLSAQLAAQRPGQIGLDSLEVPAGTSISILPTGFAKQTQIAFAFPEGESPQLKFNLEGDFASPDGAPLTISESTQMEALPRGGHLLITLNFVRTENEFNTPFKAMTLRWNGPSQSAIEESSIFSGSIIFDDFGSRSVSLRAGAPFRILGAGEIRKLKFSGGAVECEFDGEVKQLSSGSGVARRNLMPSLIVWLRSRETLFQFWASLASLTGLALAVNRWWRKPE
jgi:hypothetical protein